MRLARFLAACGLGSRRSCEALIEEGRVSVNDGVTTRLSVTVDPDTDVVCVKGRRVRPGPPVYLMVNKPPGFTCSARDPHARRLVFELVPRRFGRLFTVGRLDRDSEGLLLLTNDGEFAQRVAHPSGGVSKIYHVWVTGTVNGKVLRQLRKGLKDNGEWLKPKAVSVRSRHGKHTVLRFVLIEGRKREIRRLCRCLRLGVQRLRRIGLGRLRLGSLPLGECRQLSRGEIDLANPGANADVGGRDCRG